MQEQSPEIIAAANDAVIVGDSILPSKSRKSRKETPDFSSKPFPKDVKCCLEKTYETTRRELFRPTPEQARGARAWLVRVVARRAVEILKAQETAP